MEPHGKKSIAGRMRHVLAHSFRMRITAIIMVSVLGVSLLVVLFSSIVLGTTVVDNAQGLAVRQQESVAVAVEQEMSSIYQLGRLTIQSSLVLEDLTHEKREVSNYAVLGNNVYIELLNTLKLNENISQMAILKYLDASIKYVDAPWRSPEADAILYENLLADFRQSSLSEYGDMSHSVGPSFFVADSYALNLYFPIYDPLKVYMEIGLLCITVDETTLNQFYSEGLFADTRLVAADGTVLSDTDKTQIGSLFPLDFMGGKHDGIDYARGRYTVWTQIDTCNWYVVGTASLYQLVQDTIWPLVLMLLVILGLCILVAVGAYRVMRGALHPLDDLKERMGSVAAGDMSIRMDVEYREDEFNAMAKSFNKMVKDVDGLMHRIAEEQAQMKQIELNALQSQIKPHFLYNSLECIHWQSLMDGDKKSSELVKALANYYRLCLGKGQDVVPLRQELSHIESYLLIQNARYSDIVVNPQ